VLEYADVRNTKPDVQTRHPWRESLVRSDY